MEIKEPLRVEPWMRGFLLLAGAYNLGWGFFIYNFPDSFYQWVTMSDKTSLPIIEWQGLGILLFGSIYVIIAIYPLRFWYFLAAGLLSKVSGALWFYLDVMGKSVNKKFLFHLIMNDLIWVVPFAIILWRMIAVRTKKEPAL